MKLNTQNAEFIRSAATLADCPRDSLPQIAFAGRSNVGKSSVINRLLGRKNFARVGSAPGKTTHINYFRIDKQVYFVDLPGYGYAKVSKQERARWGQLIGQWFDDASLLTLGLLLGAIPSWWWPTSTTRLRKAKGSPTWPASGRPWSCPRRCR